MNRIIPILGEKQVSSGSISVIRSVPDTGSFFNDFLSGQWDISPKWDNRIWTMLSVQNMKFQYRNTVLVAVHPLTALNINITPSGAFSCLLRSSFQYLPAIAIPVTERSLWSINRSFRFRHQSFINKYRGNQPSSNNAHNPFFLQWMSEIDFSHFTRPWPTIKLVGR